MARTGTSDAQDKPKKPKKRRWYHNFVDAFKLVAKAEKWVPWVMLGALLVGIGLGALFGSLAGQAIYGSIMGLFVGIMAAMIILSLRTRRVSYRQIDGQPGAAFAVLDQIKRGWNIEQEPVQVNARTQDMVFRMVGRPGVVLISEGPSTRVKRLIDDERRRISRVLPQSVPIIIVESGNNEGQVPLLKLESRVKSLKKSLTNQEVAAVSKRLRSLGGMNLPIPKGIDPMRARPDRKGLRGR